VARATSIVVPAPVFIYYFYKVTLLRLRVNMAKAIKKAKKKKRAKHYEPKLKVNASFIDIINSAVAPDKKKIVMFLLFTFNFGNGQVRITSLIFSIIIIFWLVKKIKNRRSNKN
jgi:hypothetical protein